MLSIPTIGLMTPVLLICFFSRYYFYLVGFILLIAIFVWSKLFNKSCFFEDNGIRHGFLFTPYDNFSNVTIYRDKRLLAEFSFYIGANIIYIEFSGQYGSSRFSVHESLFRKEQLKMFVKELRLRSKKVKMVTRH